MAPTSCHTHRHASRDSYYKNMINLIHHIYFMLENVAEIQNFLRITKINLWSNLVTRGRGVQLHTLVDRDAEALQECG